MAQQSPFQENIYGEGIVTESENIDPVQVRAQLARIESSHTFGNADRQRRLLRFIVEETLAGHQTQLKGSVIAVECFPGRDDSIVRPELGRLRHRLLQYYDSERSFPGNHCPSSQRQGRVGAF